MSQTKDRAGQSRGHWTGKAAITETSTLALMMALTLQATPTLAQDAAQGLLKALRFLPPTWRPRLRPARPYLQAIPGRALTLAAMSATPLEHPPIKAVLAAGLPRDKLVFMGWTANSVRSIIEQSSQSSRRT